MNARKLKGEHMAPVAAVAEPHRIESVMMSVEELAERWRVDVRTIRKAIARREVIAIRVGRTIRIARSHIEKLEQFGPGAPR